jgi:hypothetical protein
MTNENEENLNWEAAWQHFKDTREIYQSLAGTPGVNTEMALQIIFKPIAERYESGERTEGLYNALFAVE